MIGGQGYPRLHTYNRTKTLSKVIDKVTVPIETLRALLALKHQVKKVRFVNSKTKFALMLFEQFRALVCVPGAPNCSLLRPLKQTVPYSTMGYENNTTATIFITDQS